MAGSLADGGGSPIAVDPAMRQQSDADATDRRQQSRRRDSDQPIAIVGYSCRFPGAVDADAFWENLAAGRDCVGEVPADRWNWRAPDGGRDGSPPPAARWGGFIDGVYEFDPDFFGMSPAEAIRMDPQQRLLLMHVFAAIEDAGHAPGSLAGRQVGVFIACAASGYPSQLGEENGDDGQLAAGAWPSLGPNRVSHFLDWHGPSEPVETAGSSSLVAIHRAAQAMKAGECEMAVAGGVNTILSPDLHLRFARTGRLAEDGRTRAMSRAAAGHARGEGIGVLVLKRLSAAERDGDTVHGLIRGSAVSHGGRSVALPTPNGAAQADLLRRVYGGSGVDTRSLGYVELHGTGDPAGDATEVDALDEAVRDAAECGRDNLRGFSGIALGSVKSGIGHLELAAGVAGVVKVLLQLKHARLAPTLHGDPVIASIDAETSYFRLVHQSAPWPVIRDADGRVLPRRAGVSGFGIGGVNAHVLIEEHVDRRPVLPMSDAAVLVPLSARNEAALREQAGRLAAWIRAGRVREEELADLAYTLQVGRDAMGHRLALVVASLGELAQRLAAFADTGTGERVGMADAAAGRYADAGRPTLDDLAGHWVAGGQVDWSDANPLPRRRIRLPTYPFARETYRAARAD